MTMLYGALPVFGCSLTHPAARLACALAVVAVGGKEHDKETKKGCIHVSNFLPQFKFVHGNGCRSVERRGTRRPARIEQPRVNWRASLCSCSLLVTVHDDAERKGTCLLVALRIEPGR